MTVTERSLMSGRGMLMIWTNIPDDAEADFNRWYDREHVAERVAMPGFQFGRRYRAAADAPMRYLALYGTESVAALSSPGYLAALGQQSPWSQRVLARMTDTRRLVGEVTKRHGIGHGVKMIAGLLSVPTADADAMRGLLDDGLLKPAALLDGVASAWMMEADPVLSRPVTPGAPVPDPNGPLTWLVAIEAGTTDAFPAVRIRCGRALSEAKLVLVDLDMLWSLERAEFA
jgi:hypothetical protein